MLTLRTHDDAGQIVPVCLRAACLVWSDHRERTPAWTVRSAPKRLLRILVSGPVLIALGMAAILTILVAVAWSDRYAGFGLVLFSPIFVPLITAALVSIRGIAGGRSKLIDAMQGSMLARSTCPACGYHMGDLPAGADGLVTCPECRAAWSSERFGHGARSGPVVEVLADWNRPVSLADERES